MTLLEMRYLTRLKLTNDYESRDFTVTQILRGKLAKIGNYSFS